MSSSVNDSYLATEVLTAPPQKLRLLLIQAAIRSGERARMHWRAGENEKAFECLIHAQEVVTELLSGINTEIQPELTKKVASLYVFIFRRLIDANVQRSEPMLDDALRVLREEQETWGQLCGQLGVSGKTVLPDSFTPQSTPEPLPPPVAPPLSLDLPGEFSGGFSLEA
jgi:flagellar protein FliS